MVRLLFSLIFIMLGLPMSFMGVKAAILVVLIMLSIYISTRSTSKTYRSKYIYWFFLYYLSGLCALAYGIFKGNPGPRFFLLTYLVWPIVFPLIFSQFKVTSLLKIISLFDRAYIFLFITGTIAFLQMNFGVFPFFPCELFGYEIAEYARPMYLFISPSGPAIVSFFILFSFLLPYYCLDKNELTVKRIIKLLFGFLYIVISSRRVMMFGFIYIPVLILLLSKFSRIYSKVQSKRTLMVYSLPIICLFFGIGYIFADTDSFTLFFSSAFSSDGDFGSGENVRLDQRKALLKGWFDNFFFGAGTGINTSVVRNDIPGVYELSYYAIFFERGLIGGLLYFALLLIPVVWTVRLVRRCQHRDYSVILLSYAVCYMSLLIANATNPYIGAFDFIWIVFLFIVILNLIDKKLIYERKNLCNYSSI